MLTHQLANPFKPTAGMNPPELIGRDVVLEEFIQAIEDGAGAPGRLLRITGARGMGKTVVLNEIGRIAREAGWMVVDETAGPELCSTIMTRIRPDISIKRFTAAPSVLGVSIGSVEAAREEVSLRKCLASSIGGNGHGLLITVDEVQDASMEEMRKLAVAVQHTIRDGLDIAFVFAGLPSMIDNVINGKTLTFLRRAVPFELSEVGPNEVARSFAETFSSFGLPISDDISEYLAGESHGYPFMIQLIGYHVWRATNRRGLSETNWETAKLGVAAAHDRFEQTVVEPALQRLSRRQLEYLLAMAMDSGEISRSGDVAKRMAMRTQSASSVRAQLIDEGIIEKAGWGELTFSIPYMSDYLNRNRDELVHRLGGE